jgi:hypothetical protein
MTSIKSRKIENKKKMKLFIRILIFLMSLILYITYYQKIEDIFIAVFFAIIGILGEAKFPDDVNNLIDEKRKKFDAARGQREESIIDREFISDNFQRQLEVKDYILFGGFFVLTLICLALFAVCKAMNFEKEESDFRFFTILYLFITFTIYLFEEYIYQFKNLIYSKIYFKNFN